MSFYKPFSHILIAGRQKDDVARLMDGNNPRALKEFFKHAANEFSTENILCVMAIKDYEKAPTLEKRSFIIEKFINPSGEKHINVSGADLRRIKTIIESELHQRQRRNAVVQRHGTQYSPSISLSGVLFADRDFLNSLYVNICETYGRFATLYMTERAGFKGFGTSTIHTRVLQRIPPSEENFLRQMSSVGFRFAVNFIG